MAKLVRSGGLILSLLVHALSARAERSVIRSNGPDEYEIVAESRTYLQLYQRALLPGGSGAMVVNDTLIPVHEYFALRVHGLDIPSRPDSVDVELSGWGSYHLADPERGEHLDGDLGTANVQYRGDFVSMRVGRQLAFGGAARYVRFDGARASVRFGGGVDAEAYAGFVALPPAFRRRGYLLLGAAPDSLVRDPRTFEERRAGSWLAGGRIQFQPSHDYGAAASFHHQAHNAELERRNLAVEAHGRLGNAADCAGSAMLDLDAGDLADARAFCDVMPLPLLSLTAEYLHTQPALFLSRQSVLSVFGSDGFDEFGGRADYQVSKQASLGGSAHLDRYSDGRFGSRTQLSARFQPETHERLLVGLGYTRVLAAQNGYHALRASLRRQMWRTLTATLEAYFYLYDQKVAGYESSAVYASSVDFPAGAGFDLLLGATLARSPYARLDAQGIVRLSYEFSSRERAMR